MHAASKVSFLAQAPQARERAMEAGIESLADVDLLALVLGTGLSGMPVRKLAAELLERFGDLERLAGLGPPALLELPGLGPAKALRLAASLELGRRASARAARENEPLQNSAAVSRWALPRLAALDHEELWVLSLDSRNGLRGARKVAQGGAHGCAVAPRDILRAALADAATAAILVHNHPGGDPSPSLEDLSLTRAVATAGRVVGVPVVDHVIVARGGRYTSLLDLGAFAEGR